MNTSYRRYTQSILVSSTYVDTQVTFVSVVACYDLMISYNFKLHTQAILPYTLFSLVDLCSFPPPLTQSLFLIIK